MYPKIVLKIQQFKTWPSSVNLKQDSINRIVNSLKLENVQHHLVVGNTIQKKSISGEFQYFQVEHDPNTKIKPGFNKFYQQFGINGIRYSVSYRP